ncbi:hypothetical protein GCM10020331_005510 [Ectobacillus funiculus]
MDMVIIKGYLQHAKNSILFTGAFFSVDFTPNHIVMTVGAAGAMNVVFKKSILNEQDEVIVLSPYFLEYEGYIQNFNGKNSPSFFE